MEKLNFSFLWILKKCSHQILHFDTTTEEGVFWTHWFACYHGDTTWKHPARQFVRKNRTPNLLCGYFFVFFCEGVMDETEKIKRSGMKRSKSTRNDPEEEEVRSPRATDFRRLAFWIVPKALEVDLIRRFSRYSMPEDSLNKPLGADSETSESDDSDDSDAQKATKMKLTDFYDAKQFENLEGSAEVKELFQNIMRFGCFITYICKQKYWDYSKEKS